MPQRCTPCKEKEHAPDAPSTASKTTRTLCAKHGNRRAQTGYFCSPLPHFTHDGRRTLKTVTLFALRARTYARFNRFSFFAFTPSPIPSKSFTISALWVKALLFFLHSLLLREIKPQTPKNNCYFSKIKTRQPSFLLRSTDGEGKCQKPSPQTLYCSNSYRHSVKA